MHCVKRKLEEHILEEVEGYEAPIPSLLILLRLAGVIIRNIGQCVE